jgi:hypothetical protein
MKSEDRLHWTGEPAELTPAERDEPVSSQKLPESEAGAHAASRGDETSADSAAGEVASPHWPAVRAAESSEGTAADIERLEASLRWLKQQSGDLRGSHADAPLPGRLSRILAGDAELDKIEIGAARSLEPENLVPPALMRAQRGNMESALASRRVPLLILIAGLVAAPIAYFTAEKSSSAPENIREARLVAVEPEIVTPPRVAKPESEPQDGTLDSQPIALPATAAPQNEASTHSDSKVGPASPPPVAASPPPAAASPQPTARPLSAASPPAAAASVPESTRAASLPASRSKDLEAPAAAPVRTLTRADIDLLMKQGEQFMAVGDVAAARIVFRRAAEAGDAAAALAMGTTYDPLILKRMGALGVTPDLYQARSWYERAKDFGSSEAPRRIEMLANR